IQQGYFPTQDRIVQIISKLFRFSAAGRGTIVVLDAGCGAGKAIHDLRNHWLAEQPRLNVALLGIESDKSRFEQAAKLLPSGDGGGAALWASIEDAAVDQPVSLLYFNPPFDRIRGVGRMENVLFN